LVELLAYLPERARRAVLAQPPAILDRVEEIRLREGHPLALVLADGDLLIPLGGSVPSAGVTRDDLDRCLALISRNSVYAYEEEVRQGFITLPGGHRVGLAGKVLLEGAVPRTIRPISGLNLRVSRELPGVAAPVLPLLIVGGRLCHTLVVSPPGAGKTTLLRDIARLVSAGVPGLGLPGQKVSIVDERSELAGAYMGSPQRDVGPRTDVLDGCPKAIGIMLALRSLSPRVIVTDEIGRPEDALAIEEAVNAGVTVVASAHGSDLGDLRRRPTMAGLLGSGVFERVVTLGRNGRPGVVRSVTDGEGRPARAAARARTAGEAPLCG
jgi:stage III sporulation protein AA